MTSSGFNRGGLKLLQKLSFEGSSVAF